MTRDDGSDRRAFNRFCEQRRKSGESPILATLNNDMRPGIKIGDKVLPTGPRSLHSNEGDKPGPVPTDQDAGETTRSRQYRKEDRHQNRSDGAKLERQGAKLDKPAVEIQGVPFDAKTARELESKGMLRRGTTDSAQPVQGWSRDRGIVYADAEKKAVEMKAAEQAAQKKIAEQQNNEKKAAELKSIEQKAVEKKAAEQKAVEQTLLVLRVHR